MSSTPPPWEDYHLPEPEPGAADDPANHVDPWVAPTGPRPLPEPKLEAAAEADLARVVIGTALREAIAMGAATSPRSLQVTIGASEIGGECHRQIAYRVRNVPAVNFPDPVRSLVGIGAHAAMADMFRRLDAGTGRYLIEEPVVYKGVPGTLDLYDRFRRLVVDWKFPTKDKVRRVRADGPPGKYVVQAHIYAAALIERGDPVDRVAIVYIPTNGDLSDLYVWTAEPDVHLAERAVEEAWDIRDVAEENGPQAVTPTPTRLCPWCAHYQPTSTDPARACPDGYRKESK